MQQRLTQELLDSLSGSSELERIEAMNEFRKAIHSVSPFREEPIDYVLRVKNDHISPDDYSPSDVAPLEKKLLLKSLEVDGFTQPVVVVHSTAEEYEIVDGSHRHELGKAEASLRPRLKGYLPVACLERERHERIAATVRHNRARGRHQIHAMSEIVRELSRLGWGGERIGKDLGTNSDEVLRLKQINGLQVSFAGRRFSKTWTVKWLQRNRTFGRH